MCVGWVGGGGGGEIRSQHTGNEGASEPAAAAEREEERATPDLDDKEEDEEVVADDLQHGVVLHAGLEAPAQQQLEDADAEEGARDDPAEGQVVLDHQLDAEEEVEDEEGAGEDGQGLPKGRAERAEGGGTQESARAWRDRETVIEASSCLMGCNRMRMMRNGPRVLMSAIRGNRAAAAAAVRRIHSTTWQR